MDPVPLRIQKKKKNTLPINQWEGLIRGWYTSLLSLLGKHGCQKEDFPEENLELPRKCTMATRPFFPCLPVTCFPRRISCLQTILTTTEISYHPQKPNSPVNDSCSLFWGINDPQLVYSFLENITSLCFNVAEI